MYLPNLTFVALPVPKIIGGTPKNWGVPGYAHGPFSRKYLTGFCSDGPYKCIFPWAFSLRQHGFRVYMYNKGTSNDFVAFEGCSWGKMENTNVLRGKAKPPTTLSDCMELCVNTGDCAGLDWAPSSSKRCWLHGPWSGRWQIGVSQGVTHYNFTREAGCGSRLVMTYCYRGRIYRGPNGYLGSLILISSSSEPEIKWPTNIVREAMFTLDQNIWRSSLSLIHI